MLEEVFGTAGRLPEMIVSGMTDLQIVAEALKHEGFTHEDIFERVDHLRKSYMTAMRQATSDGEQFFEVLPGVRKTLQAEHYANLPWLFFYSALSIPLFYAVGLLAQSRTHFAIADFWRFWVVHLWVEDFLELFTTIMVAYIFVLLGIVSSKTATRVVYLDILLYSFGGVVGTMHHMYFSGTPAIHMALGAFSAAELCPDLPDR
jgi:hypothetical protein